MSSRLQSFKQTLHQGEGQEWHFLNETLSFIKVSGNSEHTPLSVVSCHDKDSHRGDLSGERGPCLLLTIQGCDLLILGEKSQCLEHEAAGQIAFPDRKQSNGHQDSAHCLLSTKSRTPAHEQCRLQLRWVFPWQLIQIIPRRCIQSFVSLMNLEPVKLLASISHHSSLQFLGKLSGYALKMSQFSVHHI